MFKKLLPKMKYRLKVNYKSGNSISLIVFSFDIKLNNNADIAAVQWEIVDKNKNILFIGINNIESIEILNSSRWL